MVNGAAPVDPNIGKSVVGDPSAAPWSETLSLFAANLPVPKHADFFICVKSTYTGLNFYKEH